MKRLFGSMAVAIALATLAMPVPCMSTGSADVIEKQQTEKSHCEKAKEVFKEVANQLDRPDSERTMRAGDAADKLIEGAKELIKCIGDKT